MDLITSIPPTISRRDLSGDDVGFEYLNRCIQSWNRNGFRVRTLNRVNEAEQIRTLFNLEPVVFEDDRDALCKDRYGPSFREMFSNTDLSKPVCIVNADVYLLDSKGISAQIEELCQDTFLFAHRTDFTGLAVHSNYKLGVDFVAFRPDRLLPVLNDTVFTRFKIGLVWWDYVLPIAASFFMPVLRIREPFILHHMHDRAWDSATYREIRLMALDILLRLATARRSSSQAAALFAERARSLDVTIKEDAHAFFELCIDWLAGRIGPVGELQLRLDGDQEAMTEMLRSALENCTSVNSELEVRRKIIVRLQKELGKRRKDILRLRYRLWEVRRANAQLSKALAKAEAATGPTTGPGDGVPRRSKAL
jgi:hypothetical protein